ncbi:MAG: prevent-host-death family protein [Gammaproteobacteria bacterium]|nr:MAG: prevent-host-death family protein [Gammaproteobacteria bacterium]
MDRINYEQDIRPLSEFRAGVSSCLKQVTESKRPLVITQHGKGVAILCDVGEFEAMQTRLELLEEIYKAETQINEGRGIDHEEAKNMVMKGLKP